MIPPIFSKIFNIAEKSNSSDENRFQEALKKGDVESAGKLLDNIKLKDRIRILNAQDDNGNTLLHLAAKQGNLDVCVFLLFQINNDLSSPSYINKEGQTPLHLASQFGHPDIVQYLLSVTNSGFANFKDYHGRSSLHLAAQEGHLACCQHFLNSENRFLYSRDNEGRSPIHYAAQKGHDQVVEEMLKCLFEKSNAHVLQIINNKGPQAWHNSVWGPLDDQNGISPLHLAALGGHDKTCDVFIKHRLAKRIVNFADDNGKCVLHYAAMGGKLVTYNKLGMISDGRQHHAITANGKTAIHLALEANKIAMAQAIIAEHVNCEHLFCQDSDGQTALHIAAKKGYCGIIAMVITIFEDMKLGTFRDKQGMSARQLAQKETGTLLDIYRPSIQDAQNAFNVLEISIMGILSSIRDKAPQNSYLNNFQVTKTKCQLICEAYEPTKTSSQQNDNIRQQIELIYLDCCVLYSKIEKKELLNQSDFTKIEEMAKSLSSLKNELQIKSFNSTSKEKSANSQSSQVSSYIVNRDDMTEIVDTTARHLFQKYPQFISSFKETILRIKNGDFSNEASELLSEYSPEIMSQAPLLTLILLHTIQVQEKMKNNSTPEIFKNNKQFQQIALNNKGKEILQNTDRFKKLSLFLINSFRKQDTKLSEQDEKEFQELSNLLVSIGKESSVLSQNEFNALTGCFLYNFIQNFKAEEAVQQVQSHIQAGSLFQAELLADEISNDSELKTLAINDILQNYFRIRQWKWSEQFIDRIPVELSKSCLPEYVLSVFKFALGEVRAGRETCESHLLHILNRMKECGIKFDEMEKECRSLGEEASLFFKRLMS